MSKQHDTMQTDYPVCPWCGHEDKDAWEYDFGHRDTIHAECPACEKDIEIVRSTVVTYSVFKETSE